MGGLNATKFNPLSLPPISACKKKFKKGIMRTCSCSRSYFPFNIAIECRERTVPGRDNSGAPTASFGRWKWRGRGRRERCPFAPIKSNYSNSRKGNVHLIIVWPKHVLMTDIAVSAYARLRVGASGVHGLRQIHTLRSFAIENERETNCCKKTSGIRPSDGRNRSGKYGETW